MAKLITEEEIYNSFSDDLSAVVRQRVGETLNYFSPLDGYRVTSDNMKFDNYSGEANLLILEFKSEFQSQSKCYTLAYAKNDDETTIKTELDNILKDRSDSFEVVYSYLAQGTGSVDESGNTTKISLTLTPTGATKNLRFESPNIVQITGTEDADTIYIKRNEDTNGVSESATLDFSSGGKDTVYFNGATTVQDIWGGGSSDGDTLTLAPEGDTALNLTVKDGKLSGNVEIDVTNNGTHNINIGSIAGNATIKVDEGTTNLTANVAKDGTATIIESQNELSLKDGSSLNSATKVFPSCGVVL